MANGPLGGPNDAPLLTTDVPSKAHGRAGVPQVELVGLSPGRFSWVWVVPLAFRPGSSSTLATPFSLLSWAAVTPAGRRVAVWNPSIRNWIVEPVGTCTLRGKKSLNVQL